MTVKCAEGLSCRIGRIFANRETVNARLRVGFRAVCAIACAFLVAYTVESWSRMESLRFPSPELPAGQKAAIRSFPIVGKCRSGEYLFLISNLMLASGAAGWFVAGWVESRAD